MINRFIGFVVMLGLLISLSLPGVARAEGDAVNLVQNGNISDAEPAFWRDYGTRQGREVVDGAIHLTGNVGVGIQQLNVPLEAQKTYLLSFDVKVVSGRFGVLIGNGTSNGDFESKITAVAATNTWETKTRRFTAPAEISPRGIRLVAYIRNTNGPVEFYLDNVSIIEATDTYIIDGDMSAWSAGFWKNYGLFPTKEKVEDNGSLVIHAEGVTGLGIQQTNLALAPNKTYELRFDARSTSGQLSARLGNGTSNSDFENKSVAVSGGDSWNSYSRIFTTPPEIHPYGFRLVFASRNRNINSPEVEFYIDNVSINEVVEEAEEEVFPAIEYVDGLDYMVFGDSLSSGYISSIDPGYPGNLEAYPVKLARQTSTLINDISEGRVVGGSGAAINNIAIPDRNLIIHANYQVEDTDIIIIWGGINDVLEWAAYDPNAPITSLENFRIGYQNLVTTIKNRNANGGREIPILVGTLHDLTRLEVVGRQGWDEGKINTVREHISGYNQIIRDIANSEGLVLVDFDGNDSPMYKHETGENIYQNDKIHPNSLGQEYITARWWSAILGL